MEGEGLGGREGGRRHLEHRAVLDYNLIGYTRGGTTHEQLQYTSLLSLLCFHPFPTPLRPNVNGIWFGFRAQFQRRLGGFKAHQQTQGALEASMAAVAAAGAGAPMTAAAALVAEGQHGGQLVEVAAAAAVVHEVPANGACC